MTSYARNQTLKIIFHDIASLLETLVKCGDTKLKSHAPSCSLTQTVTQMKSQGDTRDL